MSPAPQCTRFIQLNVLFWIVTLATAVVVWVNLRIPLLSNHVFFVAFISIAWNVLGWTSESLSCLIMFALLLSSPSPGMSLVTWTTSSVVKHRAAILGMVLGTLKTWQNLCMFESLCKSPELLWDKVPSALLKGKEKKNVESVQGCWCVTVRVQTTLLNKHLQELMEGLTAKVFRTYNASHTLQEQLNLLTNRKCLCRWVCRGVGVR